MKILKQSLTFDDVQIRPLYSEVESRNGCNTETRISKNFKIKIPICAAPMDTVCEGTMALKLAQMGGIGFLHRFSSIEDQCNMVNHVKNIHKNIVGAAVGVKGDFLERTGELIKCGCDIILIDVAHGNHINVKRAIEQIKSKFLVDVVAGNVATREGATNLCEWGADAVRVGIGNGALCTTRISTGIGIPQITAILDCADVCDGYGIPLIADGGIRYTGDVAKAIACGASTVMLGSLLAGTKESPGRIEKIGQWPNEQLYKKYRGSASLETKIAHGLEEKNVEGTSKVIPYKGKVERIINDIMDGLRSSMSYVGTNNIKDFIEKSEFVQVTQAGQTEAFPHLLLQK